VPAIGRATCHGRRQPSGFDLDSASFCALVSREPHREGGVSILDPQGFVTATKEVRLESQNWPSIMRLRQRFSIAR
jgi:hypothetical protein